jgi:hypothetical protein
MSSSDAEGLKALLKGWFLGQDFENDPDHAKVIAWTNATVNGYNNVIRKMKYGKDVGRISVGEELIADVPIKDPENVKSILFTTNDEMKVIGYTVESQFFEGMELKYYLAEVEYMDYRSLIKKTSKIRILHEDSDEFFAHILQNKIRKAKEKQKTGGGAFYWKQFYETKEQFAEVKYNYAITAHKAQGSTYSNVLLITPDILRNKKVVERNRIIYTAMTRPKHQLIVAL